MPAATEGGDAVAYVSGLTAAFKDIADRIMERLPLFLLYIIGVTFIVLAMAFRSIVISLTAAVTTILSAFVGFGVLTLVVQEGHLLGLTGLDRTGPIETFVPPIAFAILFGLSMDYMVFLMSRIREEHVHGLNTREAVEHGIAAIGRVVVAAALIMGTVFAAFILTADRISKEFGLLLAVAILTDALVVRMTLVPAFLTLLGEKSWYIPRWLDRLLPNITIEPPHEGAGRAPGRGACGGAGPSRSGGRRKRCTKKERRPLGRRSQPLRLDDELRPGALRLAAPRLGDGVERHPLHVEPDLAGDRVAHEPPVVLRELVGGNGEVGVAEDRQALEAHRRRRQLGRRAGRLAEVDDRGARARRPASRPRPARPTAGRRPSSGPRRRTPP